MESTKKLDSPDGIYTSAIYMLLIPLGFFFMLLTEEMDHPGSIYWLGQPRWSLHCCHLFPLDYLKMESIEDMGHHEWNQD
jgi:hypothetical protein